MINIFIKVLLFGEPFMYLDNPTRKNCRRFLVEAKNDQRITDRLSAQFFLWHLKSINNVTEYISY